MKINEIAASWDRSKVSSGPTAWLLTVGELPTLENPWNQWNRWNLMKIHQIYKNPWHSGKLGSSKDFLRASPWLLTVAQLPTLEFYGNQRNLIKIYEIHKNRYNSSQLGSTQAFFRAHSLALNRRSTSDPWTLWISMKSHENPWMK